MPRSSRVSIVDVATRLAGVRARIEAACSRAGRDPESVRLLPVSKTQSTKSIMEAYDAGIRTFGENKVQELVEKADELAEITDLRWALIGHLQSNKAKLAVAVAAEFHALDSIKVAAALNRRLHDLGRSLDVFIQVNSSAEPQKFGLAPDEVEQFARDLQPFSALRVRGLMTLAVLSNDERAVRACFERMLVLQQQLREAGAPGTFDGLSMGMSGDFELAIEYGATTVRIGQAIFGERS
jgi:pyridoxal phosphate enzyme (YggS family)